MSDADNLEDGNSPETTSPQDIDFLWSWIVKLSDATAYDDVPDRYPGKRVTDLMLPELEETISEIRGLAREEYETVYLLTRFKEMETQLDAIDLPLGERTTRHTIDRRKMMRRIELLREQIEQERLKVRTLTHELTRAKTQMTRTGNDLDHLRQSIRTAATTELEKLYPAERFEPSPPPGPDEQAAPRRPSGWRGLLGNRS